MIKTTIVGFGDSITCGYGVERSITYIDRLERYMPLYFPSISWHIDHAGVCGDTTREALTRLEGQVLKHHPNIVIILFGSNDAAMNAEQFRNLDEFEKNMEKIIQEIKGHNNRTGLNGCVPIPILLTPPPVLEEILAPERNNNRLRQYGHTIKLLAKKYNCPLIDLYEHMTSHPSLKDLLSTDGLHFSIEGYNLLYDVIFSEITKLINYQGVLKDHEPFLHEDEPL